MGSRSTPARLCAYRVVRRVFEGGAYADLTLRAESARRGLDARDRAFASHLALGTVKRRMTLDHVIATLAGRSIDRIDPPLLAALRIGFFELLWSDSPPWAAVDQAVALARSEARRGGGFVNAVMRRAVREAEGEVAALGDATCLEAAVAHSHPEWIACLWWGMFGREGAIALMRRNNEPPELSLRVNTLRSSREELLADLAGRGMTLRPGDLAEEAIVVEGRLDVGESAHFREGRMTPQSRGSMVVAHALAPAPGERVLDLCAGPGVKATHIAALMRGEGRVVAVERNAARAREVREMAARLGAGCVEVIEADGREVEFDGQFDAVLVDPPCSALGTLGSRADARWRRDPGSVAGLVALQDQLLAAGLRAVKPGGRLVHSTCTINPAENEDAVRRAVERTAGTELDDLSTSRPALASAEEPRCLLTLPHRDLTDGFFIGKIVRTA